MIAAGTARDLSYGRLNNEAPEFFEDVVSPIIEDACKNGKLWCKFNEDIIPSNICKKDVIDVLESFGYDVEYWLLPNGDTTIVSIGW